MHQVKFYVTATTNFLPMFIFFGVGGSLSLFYNRNICVYKSITTCFPKVHPKICIVSFIWSLVIVKYPSNTTSFLITMPVYEILITFFFKFWIEGNIKLVACIFIGLMEVFCIF